MNSIAKPAGIAVLLEWNYSPPNFFEVPIVLARDDYTLSISDGMATATIEADVFDISPTMGDDLHEALRGRFLAEQLLTEKPFELLKPHKTRVHPDGHRDIFVEAEAGHLRLSGGQLDVVIANAAGEVLVDTKKERVERKAALSELIAARRATDSLLRALLSSFDGAMRDPNNELVHLFEIRDALQTRFGRGLATRNALGISEPSWRRFGDLCNDEPLRQGRHRGKSGSALRDATESELEEVRSIARNMIEAYLRRRASPSP